MSALSLGLLRVADFLESQFYTESAQVVRDAFAQLAHYEAGAEKRIEEDKQEAAEIARLQKIERGVREMLLNATERTRVLDSLASLLDGDK